MSGFPMNEISKNNQYLLCFSAILIYTILANSFNFTQDDAYISYRYVANYLNGDGLVYNIGEQIEGFTNFGWVIFLIFFGTLGADFLVVSKISGFLFGCGIIFLTFQIAKEVFGRDRLWFAVAALSLAAVNQSLAYWSPAGLETAAFAFFVMLAIYLYIKRSYWLIFAFVIVVWLRPDGALVVGLLILIELINSKKFPKFTFNAAIIALILSLPFVVFKISYYGSIFPNPFYAKTGFNIEQLTNGLEYTFRFLRHYGFFGFGLVMPIFFFKKMPSSARTVYLFVLLYTAYITLVGGDVLKVHRFFLPIIGSSAVLIIMSVMFLIQKVKKSTLNSLLLLITLVLVGFSYFLPKTFVKYYNYREIKFLEKMEFTATGLLNSDSTNFSVALPTIGIFGYILLGHEIIDMVGLTDSTIARHSEKPVPGMETTWKETKHNSKYILTRAPDYISFSTGIKPSAPAERALLLYPQFLNSYLTRGWFYKSDPNSNVGIMSNVFKKVHPIVGEIKPVYPVKFVENYKLGLDNYTSRKFKEAIFYFNKALKSSPEPFYLYLIYSKGFCHMVLQEHKKSVRMFEMILARDSLVYEAHKELYMYARLDRDKEAEELHERWIKELVPWYFDRLSSEVDKLVEQNRR